jgi:hypothetical protein
MGWLVKSKLSDRQRQQVTDAAQQAVQPGEQLLDLTVGKVEIFRDGVNTGGWGTLVVTDRRVFLQVGHDVRDFAYGALTDCNYSTGRKFNTIDLAAGSDKASVSAVLRDEAARIGPLIGHRIEEARLRDTVVALIALAEGQEHSEAAWTLVLKPGERIARQIPGTGLFEPRRQPGHWSGRSAGVSVPVPDTRIRVRVGKSAGTFVQGEETPTIIDTGNATVTTQRVVFQGDKYTREWDFSKLIGFIHYADKPCTAIQVSNREKTSGIVYSEPSSEAVRLAMTVAVAIFNGETDETIKELRGQLDGLGAGAAPNSPSGQPAQGPYWAADPSGRHQFRYWDGTHWTDYVADKGQQSRDPFE